MIDLKMMGAKEVQRMFDRLETKDVAAVSRKAVRAGNRHHILPEVRANALALRGTGEGMSQAIAKALTVRAMTRMRKGHYGAKTILKAEDEFVHYAADGTRYWIPNAIEYGHAFPGRGGGTGSPKDVAPRPFQRQAYEAKRHEAASRARRNILAGIEQAVKRGRKT